MASTSDWRQHRPAGLQGSRCRRRQTKPPADKTERVAREICAFREVDGDQVAASDVAESRVELNGVDEIAATIWSRIDQLLLRAMR